MKLSIGEVSKIFNITKETLRYYDKMGILKPEINKENGYRYYYFKDLEQLSLILGIKLLGTSLADIKKTIESEDLDEYKNLVLKQEEILEIKKKELEQLEHNLNKTKEILEIVTDFKNEYNFENLEIKQVNDTIYGIDARELLNSNNSHKDTKALEKVLTYLNEDIDDTYIYISNIVQNTRIEEDENLMFVKETSVNLPIIEKYFSKEDIYSMKKYITGKYVSANFYGSIDEINKYILSINKYFNSHSDNTAYIAYDFYLPKKSDDVMYFVNINLKIDED